MLAGFVSLTVTLVGFPALAQTQRQSPVVDGKRPAARVYALLPRQLIPPAPLQLGAPPAPRPALSLETDLLPIEPASAAAALPKPAS
jgi:hypothetical protein